MLRSLLATAALLPALTFAAESLVVKSDSIRLAWQANNPTPTTFQVRSDSDAQWRSLISTSPDQPAARHLELQSDDIDGESWQVESVGPDQILATARSVDGQLEFRQHFTLADTGPELRLVVEIVNRGDTSRELTGLSLGLGPGLDEKPVEGLGLATGLYSFVEAIARIDGRVERASHPDPGKRRILEGHSTAEWLGLHSRYFALLLRPDENDTIASVRLSLPAETEAMLPPRYLPQMTVAFDDFTLAAGDSREFSYTVFAGPRSRQAVTAGESDFSDLLFPGLWQWMRYLCFGLLWLLEVLFALIPSWGLAIIALAVLVRLAMYPLAKRALAGQQAFAEVQRRIQPEITEIKQNFKGGEQSERILALYEKHGVSPLAGLKPLLIVLVQIPVFIALFHVLGQAFELREASFLWIDTLAEPDRLFSFGLELPLFGTYFNLLPVLLAATTLMTLKLSPAPAADDAAQRRQNIFLVIMALGFFMVFYPFPAGMVLYWTAANVLHIAQSRLASSSR